jgi:hypothetical protein
LIIDHQKSARLNFRATLQDDFSKAFPKSAQIPLAESGWKIDEAWPEKQGLSATLTGKSLQVDLTSEFRACVVRLQRR